MMFWFWLWLLIIKVFVGIFNLILHCFFFIFQCISDLVDVGINEFQNYRSRGIKNKMRRMLYKDVFADDLANGLVQSTLLSGGRKSTRGKLLLEAICSARNQNQQNQQNWQKRPVVVLHIGDAWLEQAVSTAFQPDEVVLINQKTRCFDPFAGYRNREIVQIIFAVAKERYQLPSTARDALLAVCGVLDALHKTPTLARLLSCPYHELYHKVAKLKQKNLLTAAQAQQLELHIINGQDAWSALQLFLKDLAQQSAAILAKVTAPYAFQDLLKGGKIVLVDIGAASNTLLIESILAQIEISNDVCVVLDDLPSMQHKKGGNYAEHFVCKLVANKQQNPVIVSSPDVFATVCAADEEAFQTLVGSSDKIILLAHRRSAVSAKQFSAQIGQYEKIEHFDHTNTRGKASGGMQLFPSYSKTQASQVYKTEEYRVKANALQNMRDDEVYLLAPGGGITHAFLE